MRIAEQLYTAGLLSYPRTESSAYPASFEFRAVLKEHLRHPIWGDYSAALLSHGHTDPQVPSPKLEVVGRDKAVQEVKCGAMLPFLLSHRKFIFAY